jgi:hypothetical protein
MPTPTPFRYAAVALAVGTLASCARTALAPKGDAIAAAADPVAQLTAGFDADVRRDVETLRQATRPFHDLAAAEAAGYPTTLTQCVADSAMGGMGYHFVDRNRFDEKLEIERPEMLVYAPTENGVELVGVEYAVPFRAVPRTAQPPRLFGQELKPYEQFKYWALHVWAWRRNPAGLFADWNPAVRCGPAAP